MIADITKSTLDGILFRTEASQTKFRADNVCVPEDYKERGNISEVTVNYGIFNYMITVSLMSYTTTNRTAAM